MTAQFEVIRDLLPKLTDAEIFEVHRLTLGCDACGTAINLGRGEWAPMMKNEIWERISKKYDPIPLAFHPFGCVTLCSGCAEMELARITKEDANDRPV